MKRTVIYAWSTSGIVKPFAEKGFSSIAIVYNNSEWPIFVTLWTDEGDGIRIRSRMRDVGEWYEVKTLKFYLDERESYPNKGVRIPINLKKIQRIEKLIYEDDEEYDDKTIVVEAGIAITGVDGTELMITGGAFPYSMAVKGPGIESEFSPEYCFEEYRRELVCERT